MPVVICMRCGNRYRVNPKSLKNEGFFPLCARCRREIHENDEREYMCSGTSLRGEPCRQIKRHGKETCGHH